MSYEYRRSMKRLLLYIMVLCVASSNYPQSSNWSSWLWSWVTYKTVGAAVGTTVYAKYVPHILRKLILPGHGEGRQNFAPNRSFYVEANEPHDTVRLNCNLYSQKSTSIDQLSQKQKKNDIFYIFCNGNDIFGCYKPCKNAARTSR